MNRHRLITCLCFGLHMWLAPVLHAQPLAGPIPLESGEPHTQLEIMTYERDEARYELGELRAEKSRQAARDKAAVAFAIKFGLICLVFIVPVVSAVVLQERNRRKEKSLVTCVP